MYVAAAAAFLCRQLLDSSPPPARHEITGPRIPPGGLDSLLSADRTSFDLPCVGIHRSYNIYTHTHTHIHKYIYKQILVERAPRPSKLGTHVNTCVRERLELCERDLSCVREYLSCVSVCVFIYTKPTRHIGHVLVCHCRVLYIYTYV